MYLLDINLPSQSGIELLQEFRTNDINTPAIFLTSHKEKEVLNVAFSSGCDDYIKKPFDNDELLLRIEAVLNRYKSIKKNVIKITDEIAYDPKTLTLECLNSSEKLTQKLATLLELFLENRNKIVSKELIIETLWSEDEECSDGSLRVYIARLKNLLGKECIENTKGVGYKLKL